MLLRASGRTGLLAACACALVTFSAVPAGAAAPTAKLDLALQRRLGAAGPDEEIPIGVVLVQTGLPGRAQAAVRRQGIHDRQQQVLDALPAGRMRVRRRYQSLAGFALAARPDVIDALMRDPRVAHVYLDGRVHANLTQGRPLIGADVAVANGFTGSGVIVGLLDSGIDTDHPSLADDIVGQRCYCSQFPPGGSGCCPNGKETDSGAGSAEDESGHGTAVAGVITSQGITLGVAPDAEIYAIRVLDANGAGNFSDVAAGLDWILTNNGSVGIGVVNLSLGDSGEYDSTATSPCSGSNTADAIQSLVASGVVVVAASGNDGYDAGISFPACVADAISVGGVYDDAVGKAAWCADSTCSTILCTDNPTAADQFVCHTNSGSLLDVLAPDWKTYTSAMGGLAAPVGGTSIAAPYVVGSVALLLQQDPTRTPAQIKTLLTSSPVQVQNPDNGLFFPRVELANIFAVCGNGRVEWDEACDDGNTLNGDCCSSTCTFEPSGSTCDDGSVCTTGDTCDGAGSCSQSTPVVCDDGAFCDGVETCDPILGCQPGTPPDVDDGVVCTVDSCDEVNDVVVHTPDDALCDDGLFCNGVETCDPLLDCQAGTPPLLDDGVTCTTDSCDETNDVAVHTPDDALCDDGLFCDGAETCDPVADCQAGTAPSVDDGVACTIDSCDEANDVIVHTPDDSACDDQNPCTADSCDAITGCGHAPVPSCHPTVPASGPGANVLLALLLGAIGSALAARRLRAERR